MEQSVKSVSHGVCKHCLHEIICLNAMHCKAHDFLDYHYDKMECIQLLRKQIEESKDVEVELFQYQSKFTGEY